MSDVDAVVDTDLEPPDDGAEDGDESRPFRELRDAHKDLLRRVKDLERENEELGRQADQAAGVREPAIEYVGTKAGLSPARAKALARLHDGPVDETAVAETIRRYGLDKAVGRAGDDG